MIQVQMKEELYSIEVCVPMGETHKTSSKRVSSQNKATQTQPEWFPSILNTSESPASSTPKIHKVPLMLRETKDFDKYYVPRLVSIGPYHHGNPKLQLVENLKPLAANKLLVDNNGLQSVYDALFGMTDKLRRYYEEKTTDGFSDDEFTKMLLLDGCFILYYIKFRFPSGKGEARSTCLGLKTHQILLIQQDLFLLENQIPFLVLRQIIISLADMTLESEIDEFIKWNTMTADKEDRPRSTFMPKIRKFVNPETTTAGNVNQPPSTAWNTMTADKEDRPRSSFMFNIHKFVKPETTTAGKESQPPSIASSGDDHLLRLLQKKLASGAGGAVPKSSTPNYTFRNVHELLAVGISVKPSKTCSVASIDWRPCGFWANLFIPKITVDDSTKSMVLNLVAYEMCSDDPNESWVTSYVCFLDSLIDHSDDVKELRKAGVIDNCLGSDEEVAQLFNEIGTDLVPNPYAYAGVKTSIQHHYVNKGNSWINQLRHEYIKSPWAFIALLGGVLGLALSAIQAYTSIQPGGCDSLCKYIESHHAI